MINGRLTHSVILSLLLGDDDDGDDDGDNDGDEMTMVMIIKMKINASNENGDSVLFALFAHNQKP